LASQRPSGNAGDECWAATASLVGVKAHGIRRSGRDARCG